MVGNYKTPRCCSPKRRTERLGVFCSATLHPPGLDTSHSIWLARSELFWERWGQKKAWQDRHINICVGFDGRRTSGYFILQMVATLSELRLAKATKNSNSRSLKSTVPHHKFRDDPVVINRRLSRNYKIPPVVVTLLSHHLISSLVWGSAVR